MLPLPSLCRDLLENLLAVQRYVGDRLPHAAGLALLQQLSLSPADVPDLSDSLRENHHPVPTRKTPPQSLGACGSAQLPWPLWTYLNLPPELPAHPPGAGSRSPDVDTFLGHLARSKLVSPSCAPFGAPCFIKPKSATKMRFLVDLRAYNKLWPRPPGFSLPNLANMPCRAGGAPLHYTKLDLQNCYWSITLPAQVQGAFCLSSATGQTFSCRRLPFGWTWSPILAQLFITTVLLPLRGLGDLHFWQYLDDILLASPDPPFLYAVSQYVCHLLTKAGFLISPKSCTVSSLHIMWLGKLLDSDPMKFTNSPSRVASVVLSIFYLRHARFRLRPLARILGALQWLASPASEVGFLLAPAYALLHEPGRPRRHLPALVFRNLLRAAVLCLTPVIPCKLPPPLNQPPVFADAAEARPGQFRLGVFRAGSFASSVPAAPGISTINAAELSALLHGLSQSAKRRFTFISLLGDNAAAFFTLLRARCSFRLPSQTRTLFLIWKLVNRCRLRFSLGLVPSAANAADSISRLHSMPIPLAVYDALLRSRALTRLQVSLKR